MNAMSIFANPRATHTVKFIMSIVLVMASVSDMAGQDDCPYDLNGDGCTCANELLFFMSEYGVAGNTDYDFNDNGFRDFEDALMLSRHLGTDCPQAEVQATTGIISGLLIEPVDTLQQDLIDPNDTIPAGAITYRLYAVVTNPGVTVAGVWGNAEFPLTLDAPDGLFVSSLQTSTNNYFASNISPIFFPIFPTYDRASWWTLNDAPGDDFQYHQPLGSTADFMDDMNDGSIQFDADMGDGWFVYDYINTPELPTTSNLKLLGQFTTLGQSGICGQLNLEIRTHFDGAPTQFEQAYGLTFSTPGADSPCESLSPCPEGADLDNDGLIGTSEVLLMLAAFGDVTTGPEDLNDDGIVNVNDILILLGSFGMVCD
ncbi:MAG: hypothetical protein ACPGYZ_10120 [Flavobacteriales bacterium]